MGDAHLWPFELVENFSFVVLYSGKMTQNLISILYASFFPFPLTVASCCFCCTLTFVIRLQQYSSPYFTPYVVSSEWINSLIHHLRISTNCQKRLEMLIIFFLEPKVTSCDKLLLYLNNWPETSKTHLLQKKAKRSRKSWNLKSWNLQIFLETRLTLLFDYRSNHLIK